ncbi:MAG: ribonuclease E [Gammaproteobacteria bacterium]|nr:MAG: ribonuclease E [Gammaproteobacteria bacterium]
MFLINAIAGLFRFIRRHSRAFTITTLLLAGLVMIIFIVGKAYQRWDDDPQRGAVAINSGEQGESYATPEYLDQGWSESDSLWFYNTTQGSGLIPYDFFLVLEQVDSNELFRANLNMDKYRYLPQKPTFFNPDGLAVGFVKESYQGQDYVGYTCAACHTGQVNYKGRAIRIDGGPAMADMVGFLTALEKSLEQTRTDVQKRERFVKAVLDHKNTYSSADDVLKDLKKWSDTVRLYNTVNHSHLDYGYARLDAFGRIYNRVLEHMINKSQLRLALLQITTPDDRRLLTPEQVNAVLEGINETIIGDVQFALIIDRLASSEGKFPGLSQRDQLRVRNAIFNEADAPVSYPFLWDITHSDYVQWNALASNAGVGPLGRNTGEVIGVFGILDWKAQESRFSLSALITGEKAKKHTVDFKSSIDLTNLSRIESHLNSLQSPQWPEKILGEVNKESASRGEVVYNEYCASCHQVVERDNWDRLVVANMSHIDIVGTDPTMALNSVNYTGYAGNFESVYQDTDVGSLVVQKRAPVVQVLTAATKGAVATPDADKWVVRRFADWAYMLGKSFFDNEIKASVKSGNYKPDTTATPYQSLLSYKARSLNGIWATAPYLHNGSVPNLWSLLQPAEERPTEFCVGNREFDPVNVGFTTDGCNKNDPKDKHRFIVEPMGNRNTGHEYGTGKDDKDKLTEQERWDLIEYIKTL